MLRELSNTFSGLSHKLHIHNSLYMDINGFEQINDHYGHAVGDLVLRETSYRPRSGIRESDLVFRTGGDEFTAVLQDISSEEIVLGIADKIITAVSEPICHQELTLKVTISMGIALYPLHATNIASLIELSDRAMYQARRAGSNCFRMAKPETT